MEFLDNLAEYIQTPENPLPEALLSSFNDNSQAAIEIIISRLKYNRKNTGLLMNVIDKLGIQNQIIQLDSFFELPPYVHFYEIDGKKVFADEFFITHLIRENEIVCNEPELLAIPNQNIWKGVPPQYRKNDYQLLKQNRILPGFGSPLAIAISEDNYEVYLSQTEKDFNPAHKIEGMSFAEYCIVWNAQNILRHFTQFHSDSLDRLQITHTLVASGYTDLGQLLGELNYRGTALVALNNWQNDILERILEEEKDPNSHVDFNAIGDSLNEEGKAIFATYCAQ